MTPALNLTEIPNPLTPMALLPPIIAYQTTIGSYLLVGTLGAYIWDILIHIGDDYLLVTRLWSLLFILSSAMFETFPLKRCAVAQTLVEACFSIAVPSTCLLFFLRARAIYNRDRYLNLFFLCLWLSVAGTAATVPTAITAINIGPTPYCLNVGVKPYAGGIGITPLLHDTIIFLAISWRLYKNSYTEQSFSGNIRSFITGDSLPHFSRAVLKDGQLYYLITVTANAVTVAMFYNKAVAPTYRVMFTVCNLMLTNAMGCRVFRNTKFGYHQRITTTADILSGQSLSIPLSAITGAASRSGSGLPHSNIHVNVDVSKIETVDDLLRTPDKSHQSHA
ncbi:hypothetical protein MIND_00309900 [Mycena indigotica]|uniref:Uncharacterized protein n=1 Tax=Mycena indigotica TaxID=2126181 RepID=A0A8H6WAQ4_9AGAR|nr:uncharacterized protein MIND_00309900 [Mycena indigotica]KAF7309391.1 hypothetical protein MIND_00309900 [Mycena indigotica]